MRQRPKFAMFEKALIPDNLGQNVCRIFHILVQFLFVSGERELDYYQQNLDYVRSKNQRKLDKFTAIPEKPGIDSKYIAGYPKNKF